MAKKIKYPLKMSDGFLVRNIDELREHFDTESVMLYYLDGKLDSWLEDRGYNVESERIRCIDVDDSKIADRIIEILGVNVDLNTNQVSIESYREKKEKIELLRRYTDDEAIINNIDIVAFNQSDVDRIISFNGKVVYLCGSYFEIPYQRGECKYIGINCPEISIVGDVPEITEEQFDSIFTNIVVKNKDKLGLKKTIINEDTKSEEFARIFFFPEYYIDTTEEIFTGYFGDVIEDCDIIKQVGLFTSIDPAADSYGKNYNSTLIKMITDHAKPLAMIYEEYLTAQIDSFAKKYGETWISWEFIKKNVLKEYSPNFLESIIRGFLLSREMREEIDSLKPHVVKVSEERYKSVISGREVYNEYKRLSRLADHKVSSFLTDYFGNRIMELVQ